MFTTQFWLIVIGFAQMIGCSWICSKFQKRSYKREIRSRHSYVLLAKLLAEEERLRCNVSKCREDGTGEVYLGLPEGIIKVFSLGKRIRDAAFFLIIMLVTFAATLLKPQNYVSSRTIQKCVEHVSTST